MTAIENYLKSIATIMPPPYKEFNQWMIDNGKMYEAVTQDLGEYKYLAMTSKPKECFKNSLMASMLHNELKYVEGYFVTETIGFPFEHGFNVNSAGEVIDFTSIAGGLNVIEYYGVEVDKKYFKRFMNSKYNGVTSLLHWYYMKVILKK